MSTVTITEESLALEELLAIVDGARVQLQRVLGTQSPPAGLSWISPSPVMTPFMA